MGNKTEMLADEIARNAAAGHLRADHLTHIRCEVPSPGVVEALERFLNGRKVQLISLMDHTPGQRQFRDNRQVFHLLRRQERQGAPRDRGDRGAAPERRRVARAAVNRPEVVAIARRHAVPSRQP